MIKFDQLRNQQDVTITNLPWGADDEGVCKWECNGQLEKAEDEGETHFVRVKNCYNGVSGVNFLTRHIREIESLPSGRVVIVVR